MYLTVDGMDIFYKKAGRGPKVLLLHGWGGCADSFLPVFNYLSSRFEVYALDFPGFGKTAPPAEPWGVEDYMRVTYEFIKLLGIEKTHIIAHSFGGRVTIMLAALHPEVVGKIVLVDSAGLIPKRSLSYYLRVYTFKLMKKLYIMFSNGPTEEKLKRFYERYGSKDYKEAGNLRSTFVKVVNQDLKKYLPSIKSPTLLIWGEKDDQTPLYFAKIMERQIPDAGLVVFKGAGHFSYLDRLYDFNIIVSKFFEGNGNA